MMIRSQQDLDQYCEGTMQEMHDLKTRKQNSDQDEKGHNSQGKTTCIRPNTVVYRAMGSSPPGTVATGCCTFVISISCFPPPRSVGVSLDDTFSQIMGCLIAHVHIWMSPSRIHGDGVSFSSQAGARTQHIPTLHCGPPADS